MKINPRTVRAETLIGDMFSNFPEDRADALAAEYGFSSEAMTGQVIAYLSICARVEFEDGEVDFEVATGRDDPDTLLAKFVTYLNSERIDVVSSLVQEINPIDRFIERALRPTPPPETEKN